MSPLSKMHEWERYDDAIDYYEESGKGCRTRIKYLDQPIYPQCWWVDTRTGRVFTSSENSKQHATFELYKMYRFRKYRGAESREALGSEKAKRWLKKCLKEHLKINSIEEADKYIQPYVEMEIQIMCAFMGIYKDPLTVFQMKPIVYTYWS